MVLASKSSKITKITINYNGFGIQIIKNNKNNNYMVLASKSSEIIKITINYNGFGIEVIRNNRNYNC